MFIKNEIKPLLPIKDLSNIYVVADFDRTIIHDSSLFQNSSPLPWFLNNIIIL